MASDIILKILTLGESTVGKTSIILRYTENAFHSEQLATIGIDFKNKIIDYRGKKVKLLLWDTAGQERFKNMAAQYYKGADGVLIVYDITNAMTFTKIKNWVQQLSEKADLFSLVLYLIGNKSDSSNREVSYEEGENYAQKNNMKFFETSALNNEDNNIGSMFDSLVNDMYDKNLNKFDESFDNSSNIQLNKKDKMVTVAPKKKCC